MKKGFFVLIERIESTSKDLFKKISFLCGENPGLNLNEKCPKYIYFQTAEEKFKIHE
jgi:hypothetical protein